MEERIQLREKKQTEKRILEFGEAAKAIHKSIEEKDNLPTIDEILQNIESKEQLMQLKEMLLQEQKSRKKDLENVQKKGGK